MTAEAPKAQRTFEVTAGDISVGNAALRALKSAMAARNLTPERVRQEVRSVASGVRKVLDASKILPRR